MDLTSTTVPDSTQVNAEDFIAGPRTVTITGVNPGTDEQPVNVQLAEYDGRVYRPGKSMRRVMVAAWGADSAAYIGKRLTLFCDPSITFGRDRTGGIRISEMSGISKPLNLALTVSRGKRAPYVVKPLADLAPVDPNAARIAALRAEWNDADEDRRAAIKAEVDALTANEPADGREPA